MKVFQSALLRYALLVCTVLMTACTNPGYNDNPSQQITTARVGCLAATDFFAVYFNLHVQPSRETQDSRLKKEVFRSYCNDIPTPGRVFFTADLVGSDLRNIPIGIRIVEQGFTGDEGQADSAMGLRTLSETPAKTYPKGVIEAHFDLAENGRYAVYLITGGNDAASKTDALRIPLNVGVGSGTRLLMTGSVATFGLASALALVCVLAFRYLRRRKVL